MFKEIEKAIKEKSNMCRKEEFMIMKEIIEIELLNKKINQEIIEEIISKF